MNKSVKKAIGTFLIFLAGIGLYTAAIAIIKHYLRTHNMLTPFAQLILLALVVGGFCVAYRWLAKRLNKFGKDL